MRNKLGTYSLFGGIIICLCALQLFAPFQIINSDSVTGFEALKGWKTLGQFNCTIQPDPANIATYQTTFLTWWSPGQYLVPYFIQSLFHLSLGKSIIIVNFLASFLGLIGFYKIFKFYDLPERVVAISLLLILSSNTVLYRFISYQGGETLSFLFFPWLFYAFIKTKNPLLKNVLIIPFLIIGFFAKSQMLMALAAAFFLVSAVSYIDQLLFDRAKLNIKKAALSMSGTVLCILLGGLLLYVFFISRGINPSNIDHFNLSAADIFVPLSSPITCFANISDIMLKLGDSHSAVQAVLLLLCTIIILFVFLKSGLRYNFNLFVFTYFLAYSALFIFLYAFDAKIDYGVRHFKFVGFFFFPILINYVSKAFSYRTSYVAASLLFVFSLFNFYRLSKTWFSNTYVTQGDYRLTNEEFPREVYNYLVDKSENFKGNTIVFSPFESRWAIDKNNFICARLTDKQVYSGHGYPVMIIQKAHDGWENEVRTSFPAYNIQTSGKVGEYLIIQLN